MKSNVNFEPLPDTHYDAAVLGGGVIGLCAALRLAQTGAKVAVVERDTFGGACSHGNAGMLVPSHIVPLAAPGMIAKGLRYMFRSDSPFYIKPRLSPDLLSWTLKFRASCTRAHVARSLPLLHQMTLQSTRLFDDIQAETGRNFGLSRRGILMLHQSEAGRRENLELAQLADAVGLEPQILEEKALRQLEPCVPHTTEGGVYFKHDRHLDPAQLMTALHLDLADRGVALFPQTSVQGFQRQNDRVTLVKTTRGDLRADHFIAAFGSWSPHLLRELNLKLPIQPAKGYSVTLPTPSNGPQIPMILTDEHVAITPMASGLRFAGTLELSGLDGRINRARVAAILKPVPRFIPDFRIEDLDWNSVWFGYRPASPDGLPFIGPAPAAKNLIIAAGHAMLGVTLGPITGRLIAQMVSGSKPDLDLELMRVDRFS